MCDKNDENLLLMLLNIPVRINACTRLRTETVGEGGVKMDTSRGEGVRPKKCEVQAVLVL